MGFHQGMYTSTHRSGGVDADVQKPLASLHSSMPGRLGVVVLMGYVFFTSGTFLPILPVSVVS